MNKPGGVWYRRLQVQMWLWSIIPLTMTLVAVVFTNVYSHQRAMRDFVWERDLVMARLLARQIEDALGHGTVRLDGTGLSLILDDVQVGQTGRLYVVDTAGSAVYHSLPRMAGADLSGNPAVQNALHSRSGNASGELDDGSTTLASFGTVGETGWRVVVEERASDVIVPILRVSATIPLVLPLAILLSLVIIYFSFRTIVRPLQSLSEAAGRTTGGEFSGLELSVGGVEEIRELQDALNRMIDRIRSYQTSIRDYVEGITSSQEAERARLSRELHDQTVQDLIAITQRMQMVQRSLESADVAGALRVAAEARTLIHSTLDELRRLIQALRPVFLAELGFLPAIETLTAEAGRRDTSTDILVRGEPRRLRPDIELAAFRVVQEALQNAVQHANAGQIVVSVLFDERELVVSVEDDGDGFVAETAPDVLTRAGHFGLTGMRERTVLAGGRLDVTSTPGEGTRVSAHFPCEPSSP